MTPSAIIVSLKVDWTGKAVDVMHTFVDWGDDPIEEAAHFIKTVIGPDFPAYMHIIRGNAEAQEIHKRAVLAGLGITE